MIRKDYSGADHCVGVGNDSAEARGRRSPARAISGPMDKALFVPGLRDVGAWTDPPRWSSCRCGGSSLGVTVVPKLKRAAFAAMQGREPAPRFAILSP